MAFKMKNPSIAKMAKAAGSNRVAMKMKAESAMKHSEDSAGLKHGEGGHLKPADDVSTRGKAATDFYNKKKSPNKLKPVNVGTKGEEGKIKGQDSVHGEGGAGKEEYTQQDRRTARAKKQSAMKKVDSWDHDMTQTEKQRQRDRGEFRNPKQKRRNWYNEKKTRRKAEKSKQADAKAREARARADEAAWGKNFEKVEDGKLKQPRTKKEQREANRLSRKAARKTEKAKVAEAVAMRQLRKKDADFQGPEKPKREKKAKLRKHRQHESLTGKRTKFDVLGSLQQRKRDRDSGVEDARKARNKAAKQQFKKERKSYRQGEGLRGAINVRRKAKGKDEI